MSFANKVVIVTGASSGIGAAAALQFAKEGANVVLIGRNESKLKNVSEKCASSGKTLIIKAEVTNDDDVKRIISETIDKFGQIDVLVNNAGMGVNGGILSGNILKAYDQTMAVNMRAVVHLTALAAPHLVKTKGNIVNISSIAGKIASAGDFMPYAISKAALDHFTRGAALELAPSGVRVNGISPGPVRTDFLENAGINVISWDNMGALVPLKRCSEPDEIADIILYLASDRAKGVTGSDFVSDNGGLLRIE